MLREIGRASGLGAGGLLVCALAAIPACLLDGGPVGGGPVDTTGEQGGGGVGYGSSGGPASECGDGVAEAGEACDGGDLGGASCEGLGYPPGEIACAPDCAVDASGCDGGEPWWDPAWRYRMNVTIDGAMSPVDWTSFVTLVAVGDAALANAQPDGDDFVFVVEGGDAPLAHEVERFDPESGRLLAWVKVPAFKTGQPNVLTLYFGNEGVPSQEHPNVVWGEGYAAVWHLGEHAVDEQAGALHPAAGDSSFDGVQLGNTDVAGKIGGAQAFDGDDDRIDVVGGGAIVLSNTNCTVSAWIRTTDPNPRAILTKSFNGTHSSGDILLGVGEGGPSFGVDSYYVTFLGSATAVTDGLWHHVVWTQSKDSVGLNEIWTLFVDGLENGSKQAYTNLDVSTYSLRIGGGASSSYFPASWRGDIDEVQISTVARDQAWVTASYNNQSTPAKYIEAGPVQKAPPPAP